MRERRRAQLSEEWNDGAWLTIRDFLAPALFAAGDVEAELVASVLSFVRGHPMAKATLVNAVLDAELRAQGRSLASYLGAVRDRVECGVSVGIAPRPTRCSSRSRATSPRVTAASSSRSSRAPTSNASARSGGEPRDPARWTRTPPTGSRTSQFRRLDAFGLLMIEQPLHHEDLWEHSQLQREIRTDICLDESIRSAADARAAIELGACRIVNIKQGRVGGLLEARRVHDVASELGVPVWCGGMLETGIGRSTNLALAALPDFRLPGDTSATSRYFAEDLTEPLVLAPDGTLPVPDGPGIGVEPDPQRLEAATRRTERFEKE